MNSVSPKYVFIDESEGVIGNRPYHVAVASVWQASQLKPFRSELLKAISDLINPAGHVNQLPELHGSDMAPGYSDDIKLSCYKILAELVLKYDVRVYRLGYFDTVPLVQMDFDPLAFSISEICSQIGRDETGDLIFTYELNISRHKKIEGLYNDTNNHYMAAAIGSQNINIPNLDNIVGRFYCDKKNVFMSATDIASFFLLQMEKRANGQKQEGFTAKSFPLMSSMEKCVKYNEIIQMNAWPIARTPGGPIRYMFPIIPSDNEDIRMSPDFSEKLESYWKSRG